MRGLHRGKRDARPFACYFIHALEEERNRAAEIRDLHRNGWIWIQVVGEIQRHHYLGQPRLSLKHDVSLPGVVSADVANLHFL